MRPSYPQALFNFRQSVVVFGDSAAVYRDGFASFSLSRASSFRRIRLSPVRATQVGHVMRGQRCPEIAFPAGDSVAHWDDQFECVVFSGAGVRVPVLLHRMPRSAGCTRRDIFLVHLVLLSVSLCEHRVRDPPFVDPQGNKIHQPANPLYFSLE